ncbi:uncharacterized protein [Rhodnius prolixus]|uniref:uncharacterized protein n=1 Tax=Rhodnius prolixus TaxID=13249 RepID=UPI003D18982A
MVGSSNHYSFQRQYHHYNDGSLDKQHLAPSTRYRDIRYPINEVSFQENVHLNYPLKTVRRYTDRDGNVKVSTSYSNRDEHSLPVYKDASVRTFPPTKLKTGIPGYYVAHPPNTQLYTYAILPTARSLPEKQTYSGSKAIRFPENDSELNVREYESTVRDGDSSKYAIHSSYDSNYKHPEHTVTNRYPTATPSNPKSVAHPLQGASSTYTRISDFDHAVDDHDRRGTYHDGSYDYSGGISTHKPHWPVTPHVPFIGAFGNEKGKSYSHGQHEENGDKGTKGHKNYEKYNKGHSEKHGQEEKQGGRIEENVEKTGHHDEVDHFAKGHISSSGHKGFENEHSKGHKKGHKTKGFRTVHHKDEYKKDEIFYDEEHDAGIEKNHGEDEASHKHTEGKKSNKGHLDSGYKGAQKDFHGDKKEGHSYETSEGHAENEGHKSHHAQHGQLSQGSGHTRGETHAHGG